MRLPIRAAAIAIMAAIATVLGPYPPATAAAAKIEVVDRAAIAELLIQAVLTGDDEIIHSLLESGLSPEVYLAEAPLLAHAAARGDVLGVAYLLAAGAEVDKPDAESITPLTWAVSNGHALTVRVLLMHGANANTVDHRNLTPIMHAAWNGFPRIVAILLKFGADPTIPDELGENALHYAALGGNQEAIQLIRDAILAAPSPPPDV